MKILQIQYLEQFAIFVTLIIIFLTVYNTLRFIFGIRTTSNYSKERLLAIKYMGRMKISSTNYKSSTFNVMKIRIEMLEVYKKHLKKLNDSYIRCHLKLDYKVKETLTLKYIIFCISSVIVFFYLLFIGFSGSILKFVYVLFLYITLSLMLMFFDYYLFQFIFKIKKAEVLKELMYLTNLYETGVTVGETTPQSLRNSNVNINGLLHDEIELALDEYDSSVALTVALNNLSRRLDIKEITNFVDFIKRNDDNTHLQISKYSRDSRQERLAMQARIAKARENSAPQRLMFYNALGFIALIISFIVPIAYPLFTILK